MAKKQRRYRLSDPEQKLPELIGKTVSLIMKKQQVYQVKVLAIEGETLLGSDGLQRVHQFPLRHIEEVIVEMQA